jgi:hypothetical protein
MAGYRAGRRRPADQPEVRWKYGDFAYRLAHLDAGCAATQLASVCQGYGLAVTYAAGWDDRLSGLLELYRGGEIITAVAGLHHPEAPPCL